MFRYRISFLNSSQRRGLVKAAGNCLWVSTSEDTKIRHFLKQMLKKVVFNPNDFHKLTVRLRDGHDGLISLPLLFRSTLKGFIRHTAQRDDDSAFAIASHAMISSMVKEAKRPQERQLRHRCDTVTIGVANDEESVEPQFDLLSESCNLKDRRGLAIYSKVSNGQKGGNRVMLSHEEEQQEVRQGVHEEVQSKNMACSTEENDNDEKRASSRGRTPVSRTPLSESHKKRNSEKDGMHGKPEDTTTMTTTAEGDEVFECVDAVRRPAASLILPVKLRWKVSEEAPPTALPESGERTERQYREFEEQLLRRGGKSLDKSTYVQVTMIRKASSSEAIPALIPLFLRKPV
ncbi:hypothetical protein Aduo_013340 [Ancylostoma duodenale]